MTKVKKMTRKEAKSNKYSLPRSRALALEDGSPFYCTQDPCKSHKHVSPRETKTTNCVECIERIKEERKSKACGWRDNVRQTERTVRYRARKLGLLPDDYDSEECLKFYLDSAMLNERLEDTYEVDHMIPLSRGGLHHQDNLLVMPKSMNRRKRNKTLPELITSDFVSDVLSAFTYGKSVGEFIDEQVQKKV
jgi:hypothetical protein